MSNRLAQSQRLEWYHFAPLVMGLEAVVWLIWVTVSPSSGGTTRVFFPTIWMVAVAVVLGILAVAVCRRRTGLGDQVALWLCLIWGKDETIGLRTTDQAAGSEVRVGYTGLSEADFLVLLAGILAGVGMVMFPSATADLNYAPAVVLVLLSLVSLVLLPGVPSVDWAAWRLREVPPDEQRAARLIRLLKTRAGSPDEVLTAIRKAAPSPVVPAVEKPAEAPSAPSDRIVRQYKVSVLRIPVALSPEAFSAEPQVVAIERITLEIDSNRLETLRQKNRSQPLAYQKSLDDHIVNSRSAEIFELSIVLEALFRKYRLSPWDRLQTVLGFCQEPNIRYVSDNSAESIEDLSGTRAGEYCRYPLETLVDQRGDCDCHAVLAACLFYTLGYDCCVFRLKRKDRKAGHMAIGVVPPGGHVFLPEAVCPCVGSRRYYYCETTGAWKIGRIPEHMDPETIEICWPSKT